MSTQATKRTCRHAGCITILRSTRKGDYCSAHEDPRTEIPAPAAVSGPRAMASASIDNLKKGEPGEEWVATRAMLADGPMTARHIAARLGTQEFARVNRLLYRMYVAGVIEPVGRQKQDIGHRVTIVRLYGLTSAT